jgi:molecular chaperone GrpE
MKKNKEQEENSNSKAINSEQDKKISDNSLEGEEETQIVVLEETIKALEEKVLRSHAEIENVRKNSQKEILKARVFSAETITKDLLSPIDNLERSLQHAEEKIPRSLVELVLKEISKALTNSNIETIDPLGDKFDPNIHEALSIKEDKSKKREEILEVIQKGYKIQDRVIRPALVIVNKI